jgi:membrane dipeptidase
LIADLHSDLLIDVAHRRIAGDRDVFRARHLPALRAAGIRVQVLAVWTPTMLAADGALRWALRLLDAAAREEQESDGALRIVRTTRELEEALESDAIAGILGIEGAEPLGRDPELIRTLAALGVRVLGPTWNRRTPFADGVLEDAGSGFTPLGRRLLSESAALGIALDLSHLGGRAVREALESYPAPVFASHSNAAAVHPSPRNIGDELIAGIASRGGVVGLNFLPAFVGATEVAPLLARHARHIAEVGGPSVPACGADFVQALGDEGLPEPRSIDMPDDPLRGADEPPRETAYADLARELGDHAQPVLWDNAMAFLRRALDA